MIEGITFLGVRTPAIREMRVFYEEVWHLVPKHDEPDFVAYHTPRGSRIELFGPERHPHFDTGPVGGLEVPDIVAARRKLEQADIELLSDVEGSSGGTQWLHYRGPDGNVYEVVHHPHSTGAKP